MAFNDTTSLLRFLETRKSGSAKSMGGPGPSKKELQAMLQLAVRVPDHGKLAPWRFIVFEGPARSELGKVFASRWSSLFPTHGADMIAFQANLFLRAPVIVAVVSKAEIHPKIPVWEQQLSAAAVCFNLELAAAAHGFDAQWQTDWVAYDEVAKKAMGAAPSEQIAGLIYIGHATAPLEDRPRPDAKALTTWWGV